MRLLGTSLTILVVGFAAGGVARLVLPRWTSISWSGSTLAAIVGSGLAGAASEPFVRRPHLLDWRVALASLAGTLAVVAVAGGDPGSDRTRPLGDDNRTNRRGTDGPG